MIRIMENSEKRMKEEGEINRFKSDVDEEMYRIKEKDEEINDEMGSEIKYVLEMIRRNEGLENELVDIEEKMKVMVEDDESMEDM